MKEGLLSERKNVDRMTLYWWKHRHFMPRIDMDPVAGLTQVFVHCADQHCLRRHGVVQGSTVIMRANNRKYLNGNNVEYYNHFDRPFEKPFFQRRKYSIDQSTFECITTLLIRDD